MSVPGYNNSFFPTELITQSGNGGLVPGGVDPNTGIFIPASNPTGVGFNGSDPNFRVPRVNPAAGGLVMTRPGQNAILRNSDRSPFDAFDAIIRREDFPPGAEGDQAYIAALQSFGRGPVDAGGGFSPPGGLLPGSGRDARDEAIFRADQAAQREGQGGSSTLAIENWARNNPQAAMTALFATDEAGNPILDDHTARDIIIGLGGVDAVRILADQERQKLIDSGVIPQPVGRADMTLPAVPDRSGQINQVMNPATIGQGSMTLPAVPDRSAQIADAQGGGIPMPGDSGVVANNFRADYITGPDGYIYLITPDGPILVTENGAGQPGRPVTAADFFGRFTDQPAQPQGPINGSIVGGSLPTVYQYTNVGNDVFLDVTNPETGMVQRFTGDVVQGVYESQGFNSFDEMVMALGYPEAVALLFGAIAPPAPQAPNVPPPAPRAAAAGPPAAAAPPPPPPPPNRPREATERTPGFTR